MINGKDAAVLYLGLLTPWETQLKQLPQSGSFDIRSKDFIKFKRSNALMVKAKKTVTETDMEIGSYKKNETVAEQIIIVSKGGDNSTARSMFRNLRNSVAHASVNKVKIKNKNYLIFEAKNPNTKLKMLYAKIQNSKIKDFIAALKSTVKKHNKAN